MISKPFKVIGNLKMHAVGGLLQQYADQVGGQSFGLLVPAPYLTLAQSLFENTSIWVGAQTLSSHGQGARTGEFSAKIICDVGIETVLIGHSEVRARGEYAPEQIKQANNERLNIIYCVGESAEAYEYDQMERFLTQQLNDLSEFDRLTIAYEPVWAIGSGQVATIDHINKAIAVIRSVLREKTSNFDEVKLLYGGSVNNKNCLEIAHEANVNGFLIGGAALDVEKMLEVVNLCR